MSIENAILHFHNSVFTLHHDSGFCETLVHSTLQLGYSVTKVRDTTKVISALFRRGRGGQ